MFSSNRPLWALVGLPLVGLLLFGLVGKSDKDKFDQLQVGMSAKTVQSIVSPRTGGRYARQAARFQRDIGDNETLHLNGNMVLTIRNGVLVDKKWIGKEDK
jgi:hypothetical protein